MQQRVFQARALEQEADGNEARSARARGRGFATEALAALARWALTAGGLQRVWLNVNTDNLASLRVAQKAGFTREGTLRRASMEEDGLHDIAVLALLDDEI